MFTRARLKRWTDALRANPEQQTTDMLANETYTGFCCLGKLCEVEGIPRNREFENKYNFYGADEGNPEYESYKREGSQVLCGKLAEEFGHVCGDFQSLGMPRMTFGILEYPSATVANDGHVPWAEIAAHFDKYYPCEDEQV